MSAIAHIVSCMTPKFKTFGPPDRPISVQISDGLPTLILWCQDWKRREFFYADL